MSQQTITIEIIPNEKGAPVDKLADAELHFHAGDLEGLKLVGFAVWERRTGSGRNVTFPARVYSVNGERRSFALLRPREDAAAQDRIRDLVLAAYAEWERAQERRNTRHSSPCPRPRRPTNALADLRRRL